MSDGWILGGNFSFIDNDDSDLMGLLSDEVPFLYSLVGINFSPELRESELDENLYVSFFNIS